MPPPPLIATAARAFAGWAGAVGARVLAFDIARTGHGGAAEGLRWTVLTPGGPPFQCVALGAVAAFVLACVRARRPAWLSLGDVRRAGSREAARQILQAIPASTRVLLHLDIDVFRKHDMPAGYFPHPDGLTLSEGMELLGTLLGDPRIRIIEVTEYAALRDIDQRYVSKLVDLLAEGLRVK